jgi:urease subunit alpha
VNTAEPRILGPQFRAFGATPADISVAFASQAAAVAGGDGMPTRRRRVGVRGTRGIGSADMVRNSRLGGVAVNHANGRVTLDDELMDSAPADSVSLSRIYFL